ncbi:MAG: L-serine ammonia-lyase [Corallococcus sp.]|nr:L-serine ammonia-lyase [Corallococcus sp.]MCM1360068.1 L-serine ammonia-lyase [Corallococcus sp.]MCM1395625.1 L-serine ammonia-lyase [Corallococcus sp.]
MKSLKHLYKKGIGPSSSHTMGPAKAAERFLSIPCQADDYQAVLYGSLAATGKGHGTDRAIRSVFSSQSKNVRISFDLRSKCIHPNTLDFVAYLKGEEVLRKQYYSVGGGEVVLAGENLAEQCEVYPHDSFAQIKEYCRKYNLDLAQYALAFEGEQILDYVADMWKTMKSVIDDGLQAEGVLPGGLNVVRRAKKLFCSPQKKESAQSEQDRIVAAYAFAVGEQNAAGCEIVTAPTCGASGVLPAVFRYFQQQTGCEDGDIVNALLVSGIVGNLVKTNASISGAECGCQAEIGTACAMAAAGLAYLNKMTLDEIEYSAEVALEHHLGLTCDPVCGLVQIPCIERNAVGAMRAINAVSLASFLTDSRKISLDTVISVMYQTGRDLSENYRETANGGLAKVYKSS